MELCFHFFCVCDVWCIQFLVTRRIHVKRGWSKHVENLYKCRSARKPKKKVSFIVV